MVLARVRVPANVQVSTGKNRPDLNLKVLDIYYLPFIDLSSSSLKGNSEHRI